jgi:hypothetical protein
MDRVEPEKRAFIYFYILKVFFLKLNLTSYFKLICFDFSYQK